MTQFRPCIDLHQGVVKQIVGGSLTDGGATTNFVSDRGSAHYANLFKTKNLTGGHLISLGPNNQTAVGDALAAYPQGLQYGGGVTIDNAADFLDAGASQVIVTSSLFENQQFSWHRLADISRLIGQDKLVIDLSCRKTKRGWQVATDRWQTITETLIDRHLIDQLQPYCAEFLVHSADMEGLQAGIDADLVRLLGDIVDIPTTYAGGARSLADLEQVKQLSKGKIDLTIGSALDIFGGIGVTLDECVQWNADQC